MENKCEGGKRAVDSHDRTFEGKFVLLEHILIVLLYFKQLLSTRKHRMTNYFKCHPFSSSGSSTNDNADTKINKDNTSCLLWWRKYPLFGKQVDNL